MKNINVLALFSMVTLFGLGCGSNSGSSCPNGQIYYSSNAPADSNVGGYCTAPTVTTTATVTTSDTNTATNTATVSNTTTATNTATGTTVSTTTTATVTATGTGTTTETGTASCNDQTTPSKALTYVSGGTLYTIDASGTKWAFNCKADFSGNTNCCGTWADEASGFTNHVAHIYGIMTASCIFLAPGDGYGPTIVATGETINAAAMRIDLTGSNQTTWLDESSSGTLAINMCGSI